MSYRGDPQNSSENLGATKCWFIICFSEYHPLSPTSAQLLGVLEKAPLTTYEVAQKLTLSKNLSVDEEISRQVESLILNLDELGLVESAA
jgi:hypothetical protein